MADRLSNSLSDAIANIVEVSEKVNISDGRSTLQSVDVDISSYIPSGKTLIGNSVIRLGNYTLPYRNADGTLNTWVESVSSATKKIKIYSNATAWSNYTLSCILFLK